MKDAQSTNRDSNRGHKVLNV